MAATKPFFATFCDLKTVKTRKCLQLIFEVPFEDNKANEAIDALGGVPNPAYPQWVGIAPVTTKPVSELPKPEKASRTWSGLSLAEQAGIRCDDRRFQTFLAEHLNAHPTVAERDAPSLVRTFCGVESRADIKPGTKAEQRWNLLESAYRAWLHEAEAVPA